MDLFESRCARLGLAATHQRRLIYRALAESDQHPTPETVYRRVRRRIPSISLATVYRNIKTFVGLGLLEEVGSEAGSYRLDANLDRHHHLVCLGCKAVVDLYDPQLDRVRATAPNPKDFRILRYQVEALGLCPRCRAKRSIGETKRRKHYGKSRQTGR